MDPLTPKSHGEEVAVFRHGLIGAIALRSLTHGERISLLRSVSEQRVRPPGSDTTRCYSVPTLERWLYALQARRPRGPGAAGAHGQGARSRPRLPSCASCSATSAASTPR